MCTTVFNHSFNFSKAYDKFMRALTIIDMVLIVLCYVHYSKMHTLAYFELLRALIHRSEVT